MRCVSPLCRVCDALMCPVSSLYDYSAYSYCLHLPARRFRLAYPPLSRALRHSPPPRPWSPVSHLPLPSVTSFRSHALSNPSAASYRSDTLTLVIRALLGVLRCNGGGLQRLRPMSYSKSHVILIAFAIDTPDSLENVTVKVRVPCPYSYSS